MADCKDLIPTICGDRGLDFPQDACTSIRFEGVDDAEVNQGVCIDLTEGVHAYDGNGAEIPFTVSPSEIGCCDVGEHEVTYTAMGQGNKMLPSFCMGKPMLRTTDCGLATAVVKRMVNILQALPPKILGAVRTYLPLGSTFNPMDGISGVDDNGKATEVTFEGAYDDVASGEIATFESIGGKSKSLKVKLDPTQDGTPWMDTNVYTEPYKFKASPQLSEDYNAEDNAIVGGTVAWNQLVKNGNFADTSEWVTANGTFACANNIGTLTMTATVTSRFSFKIQESLFNRVKNGDKILMSAEVCPSIDSSVEVTITGSTTAGDQSAIISANTWRRNSFICNIVESTHHYAQMYLGTNMQSRWNVGDTLKIKNYIGINLTQLFGTTIADYIYSLEQANAGAGVAWFRKLFPKDYYEYNAGELISVSGLESHDTVGFNQCSGIESGKWFANNNGTIATVIGYSLTDYIKVLPNTTYYKTRTGTIRALCFDADKNVINAGSWFSISPNGGLFTTPSNAQYIRFTIRDEWVDSFNLNLSWSGYRNGEYEPYEKHSYPLDNSLTLRGIPKLDNGNLYYDGDEYASDGSVTRRYGVVDLGTLNWVKVANSVKAYFQSVAEIADMKASTGNNNLQPVLCNKYVTETWTHALDYSYASYDKCMAMGWKDHSYVCIADSAYAEGDATSFKTAMSGVYLVYELATPTTETAQGYTNPQSVEPYGTEEYVTDSIVPVGHKTRYMRIAPISGYTEVDTIVSPTTDAEDGTTYHTDLGQTVYGGTLDVVSGELVVDKGYIASYNGETLPSTWISDRDEYASGTTPSIGAEVVYELATPQTIHLTPQEVTLLLGTNNVWSEGAVTVAYPKQLGEGNTKFPIYGIYPITYHTEDECGNETTVVREVIVGDCDEDSKLPKLCQGKLCCASLECSEDLPIVCYGKVCNIDVTCSQTEITPTEA